MPQGLLPLFPLHVVVFPRTPLPLHIFEERYKEMIGEAVRDHSEFGIVLAREKGIVNIGCTVSVEKVLKRYPDGRFDILGAGRRRFEILLLDQEKDYLRGAVQFFDDEQSEPAPPDMRERVLAVYKEWSGFDDEEEAGPEPAADDPQLSFQLAQTIDDLDFRLVLLRSRSEAERMKQLVEYLDRDIPKKRFTAEVKRLAPLNGHARIPFDPKNIQ